MQSASELANDLGGRAEAFCRAFLPNGRLAGRYWQIGDISGAHGQSLVVRLDGMYGKKAGAWRDYATGERGDLLDMIAHLKGLSDFADIADEARAFLGRPEIRRIEPTEPMPALGKNSKIEKARRLMSISKPIGGTPAETYLRNRGISRFGQALSYHPGVYYRHHDTQEMTPEPAMLAAITDNNGKKTGVARTWLDPDHGSLSALDDPKRVMGRLYGHGVRFGDRGRIMGCGEGIETMLSVGSVLPKLPVTACLTAPHLGLFEIPDDVAEVWIFRDNDEAGEWGARTLMDKAEAAGKTVVTFNPVLGDFNDDLMQFGDAAMLARMETILPRSMAAFV